MPSGSSFLFALFIVVLTSGALAMTDRTAEINPADAGITASIKSTLEADNNLILARIEVGTDRGVVSLRGLVESAEQRQRAEQLAWRVEGVKSVINELAIISTVVASSNLSSLS